MPPLLLPQNIEALEVFKLCRNQLSISPMGGVIGIRLEAIKAAMDMMNIDDQVSTAEKVLVFSEQLYKKDSEGKVMDGD